MAKQNLKRRYQTAIKRIKREGILLDRTRSRRNYWSKVAKDIETRLGHLVNGQLEMKF